MGGVSVCVTMRTPGDDFDLATGFLFTERIIARRNDIVRVDYGLNPDGKQSCNVIDVTLRAGTKVKRGVSGRSSTWALRVNGSRPANGDLRVGPALLRRLPGVLRVLQSVFERTGGLHAAALFDAGGAFLNIREDVARHNTVDKIIGHALREGMLPLSQHLLFVSGRGAFEIVQKALVAGVPIVASVSPPSSLAVDLAREYGLTLIGFLRGQRFVVYSGEERITNP